MELNLGKKPFHKFTKSALIEMLEDAVMAEKNRSLPAHQRKDKDGAPKHDAEEEADEEREKTADLAEETRGKPAPIEMDEEDMSDEAMDKIKKKADAKKPKVK